MPITKEEPTPSPRAQSKPSFRELLSGKNALYSFVLAGGVGLHAMNIYVATTILPSVVKDIGGLEYYAWSTALFVVASILGSALSAKTLQRFGARGAYAVAAGVFAAGALLCAIAPSMAVLLAGRTVQGFGGGLLFALPYALIRTLFEERMWTRAMTVLSGMWGAATLVGPAIGGIFAEIDAWRAAFWSLVPVTAIFALLAATGLPKQTPEKAAGSPIALPQLALLTGAVLALSAGSVRKELVWNAAGVAAAAVFTGLLVVVERNAKRRLLPRGSFQLGAPFWALYATMSLLSVAVTSGEIFTPLFFQVLHGQAPLAAGYLAALMAAGWTLGSITSSSAEGVRAARIIMGAPALMLAGMIVLAILVPTPSDGQLSRLVPTCIALVAVGYGVGLAWPHLLTRVLRAARSDEGDLASASITTVQLFATSLGAALAGMVANLGGLGTSLEAPSVSRAALYLFSVFAFGPGLCLLIVRNAVGERAETPAPINAEGYCD